MRIAPPCSLQTSQPPNVLGKTDSEDVSCGTRSGRRLVGGAVVTLPVVSVGSGRKKTVIYSLWFLYALWPAVFTGLLFSFVAMPGLMWHRSQH